MMTNLKLKKKFMLGKCSATYGVWSAMKIQLTVYIYKNSMVKKYIFVGKSILHFVYHFYLKQTVCEQTKFLNGQKFIKKCNKNISNAKIIAKKFFLYRNPS